MLKRGARPETLAATLAIKSQGETVNLNVTYFNRKLSEVQAAIEEAQRSSLESGKNTVVAETILSVVKEWETDYPLTAEGLAELEDERPGLIMAVLMGFHQARGAELVKN